MNKFFKRQVLRKIIDARAENFEGISGKPDRIIDTFYNNNGNCLLINQCRIYNEAKRFIIFTEQKLYIIPFGKIIGYEVLNLNEGRTPVLSATTTVGKTDTGDMIKRAVIGGVLAGGVGAIIGGATAKKKTSTNQSKVDEYAGIMRNYLSSLPNMELIIKFDDLNVPTIKISFDQYKKAVEDFADVLNVVIRRNADSNVVENSAVEIIKSAFWSTSEKLGLKPTDENGKTAKDRIEEERLEQEKIERENKKNILAFVLFVVALIILIVIMYN